MTTSTAPKMTSIDHLAWQLLVRRKVARIRELKEALQVAGDGLASALLTIQEQREQIAALSGIVTQQENVIRRLLHEREQVLHQSWEA